MKKILFLDDDKYRTLEFYRETSRRGFTVISVETAEECIDELQGDRFDLVLLDHDLGGEIYCDSNREDCGMEVVRWIERHRPDHGAFIVHSMNRSGARLMHETLERLEYKVGRAPFGTPHFYTTLFEFLDVEAPAVRKKPKKSFGKRIRDYLRSLRM